MRGTRNSIKKPDKINEILDNSKILYLNLASNNTDINNLNNQVINIKDRKKTSSQDQNKKSIGKQINPNYLNLNLKLI
jgi:uncharacterized membrane protein